MNREGKCTGHTERGHPCNNNARTGLTTCRHHSSIDTIRHPKPHELDKARNRGRFSAEEWEDRMLKIFDDEEEDAKTVIAAGDRLYDHFELAPEAPTEGTGGTAFVFFAPEPAATH